MRALMVLALAFAGHSPVIAAPATPAYTAEQFYWLCARVPVNVAAINALRSTAAVANDRRLRPADLQARTAVWTAAGGNGLLGRVQLISERIAGDSAQVEILLMYRGNLPARKFSLPLVREDGVWKINQ